MGIDLSGLLWVQETASSPAPHRGAWPASEGTTFAARHRKAGRCPRLATLFGRSTSEVRRRTDLGSFNCPIVPRRLQNQ
jgi:hypothetical protein